MFLQEQVKKVLCYPELFWPFTAWLNCSSDFFKFSAFSLEFQKFFSITRTFFSRCRSEQFWWQNTNYLGLFCDQAFFNHVKYKKYQGFSKVFQLTDCTWIINVAGVSHGPLVRVWAYWNIFFLVKVSILCNFIWNC